MSTVSIGYERRAHRFALACTCGWTGHTTNLSVAAQPIAEHLRACDGEPPHRRTPYEADEFEQARARAAEQSHNPGNAKLDLDEVREIRQRCADGETRSAVATRFGVSPYAVSAIVNRRTWRHVD